MFVGFITSVEIKSMIIAQRKGRGKRKYIAINSWIICEVV